MFNEMNSDREVYIIAITTHGDGRGNIWIITQINDRFKFKSRDWRTDNYATIKIMPT